MGKRSVSVAPDYVPPGAYVEYRGLVVRTVDGPRRFRSVYGTAWVRIPAVDRSGRPITVLAVPCGIFELLDGFGDADGDRDNKKWWRQRRRKLERRHGIER